MYLVTGATGGLGRRIVRYLRSQDQAVRALVRLQSNWNPLDHWGAEIVIGDLHNSVDIQRACRGVEVIISAHGSTESDPETIEQIEYRANRELIEAAVSESVRYFVLISVLGVDLYYRESPVFRAKYAVEKALQASSLSYTILRPSGIASSILDLAEFLRQTGIYPLIGEGRNRNSMVSPDDLAQIAATADHIPAAHNQIFAVGGPQILRRDQIPLIVGRVVERDPWILPLPLEIVDGGRLLLGSINPTLFESLATLRTLLAHEFYCTPEDTSLIQSVFGMHLETLESYLRRYLD